jgi:hypothetical protein
MKSDNFKPLQKRALRNSFVSDNALHAQFCNYVIHEKEIGSVQKCGILAHGNWCEADESYGVSSWIGRCDCFDEKILATTT